MQSGKASAGAVEYVPVARVTNIAAALSRRSNSAWSLDRCGGYGRSELVFVSCKGPVTGDRSSRRIRRQPSCKEKCEFCHILATMKGKINSLRMPSVACGVICYEVARQRSGIVTKVRQGEEEWIKDQYAHDDFSVEEILQEGAPVT